MNDLSQYTTEYITGAMSLRDPQKESLEHLERILSAVTLRKDMDLEVALDAVQDLYDTCTDFERDFMSLTFALATAVGKTLLMGAFITYLYAQHGIKNFFVVAPSTTIYDKLKSDLSDFSSEKYVFNGVSCFKEHPVIIKDEDYADKNMSLFESDIHIFIFNIDKFNKDDAKMKRMDEMIGDSFYHFLSGLPDLVLIMDESHHYRADKGMQALNELHPLLGLELTGTPYTGSGKKQTLFKNVVYEYPLSRAIADGYTRTPYAVTRSDINFYNFGDEELDKMMLQDGILCHENIKGKLLQYAADNNTPDNPVKTVKPFMLVVCKDTDHATWVRDFVCSDEFRGGAYANKTIIVHSKQSGAESDANTRLLLDVERPDNPVEIVIHVNMLKEGWDVNNLYTIVPLRTAASKILREQMIGRGLRLPYKKRTGDKEIDSVMLTAHDKFDEILAEAQKGDSIFKAGNVILANELEKQQTEQMKLTADTGEADKKACEETGLPDTKETEGMIKETDEKVREKVEGYIQETGGEEITPQKVDEIAQEVEAEVSDEMKDAYDKYHDVYKAFCKQQTENIYHIIMNGYIPIPQIRTIDAGEEEYRFVDFDLDTSEFTQVPVEEKLLVQNLIKSADRQVVTADAIDFDAYDPKKAILDELREKPEIDYDKCSALLFKLISQACEHYEDEYGFDGMKNIVMMNKRDIGKEIYNQMMSHFYCGSATLIEEVSSVRQSNLDQKRSFEVRKDLYESYEGYNIKSVLFDGIKKGVFASAKFDSDPELRLARLLETEDEVTNWLRPAKMEFNITYNRGQRYVPDFVIETEGIVYLVEVKADSQTSNADVIAKRERAVKYCEVVSEWAKENDQKLWSHLFIPDSGITAHATFEHLKEQYIVE